MIVNPVLISAVAAVFGSLVGALGSTASSWIVHRHQNRRELTSRKIFHREQLYSDFITESAATVADAMQHTLKDQARLIRTYALLSRMRLMSSRTVVESAEKVVNTILETYAKPNLSAEEFQCWARERNDPLRSFSEICRRDLETLWKDV
jgi:uncharacterized iron-regulated protein